MAGIIQVLLSSLFLAVVFGYPQGSDYDSYGNDRPRSRTLLFNPVRLLEAAARLTYPITNRINNAIGNLGGFNSDLPPDSFPVPIGPPGMNDIGYNEGNARNALALLLRYLDIHAPDHNFRDSYESKSSETNLDEDFPNNKPYINSAEYNDGDNYLGNDGKDVTHSPDSLKPSTGSRNPVFSSNVNDNTAKPINVPEQPPRNLYKTEQEEQKNKREAEFEPKTSIVIPPSKKDPPPSPTVNRPAVTSNVPNQGYYIVPISSSNANQANPFIDGPNNIINMKPPVNSNPTLMNGNAPGKLFIPTADISQSNGIYTIINPNNANPSSNVGKPTFVPIFLNSDAQKHPGSTSENVYYFVSNNGGAGLSFSSVKEGPGGIPVSFTPNNGASGGKIPVYFIPATAGSGSNSPLTFVPGNNAPGGKIPVSFIPSNTGSGFGGLITPTGTSSGNPLLVYVPTNGGSSGGSPINFNSGYLIATKATDQLTSTSYSDTS